MPKNFMSVEEMGEFLCISRPIAYKLVSAEDGPPILRIGRKILIPTAGLNEWVKAMSESKTAVMIEEDDDA